jgi:chromosome segregation ATPase
LSVNRHFDSLFPVLFGGGDAKLVMTGEFSTPACR